MGVKKVAVTLPEELFDIVERAREIEHRSRSEVIQEAIRTHFGEPVYVPTERERELLQQAVTAAEQTPDGGRAWQEIRDGLRLTD
jgi:metal-responsive CopG/Arc/MetJ family transcriptional regulator